MKKIIIAGMLYLCFTPLGFGDSTTTRYSSLYLDFILEPDLSEISVELPTGCTLVAGPELSQFTLTNQNGDSASIIMDISNDYFDVVFDDQTNNHDMYASGPKKFVLLGEVKEQDAVLFFSSISLDGVVCQ